MSENTPELFARRTAVYRLYAQNGDLLYVGCSFNPNERIRAHRLEKQWGRSIQRTDIRWYQNRMGALRREARAIVDENPLWNMNTPNPKNVRAPRIPRSVRPQAA